MFDWDDLRLFAAAARSGSLAAAGARLGLDASTVGRRVARLESALQSTLFVRSASGLCLTATGARLLETASEAEAIMAKAARGEDDDPGGAVRISAPEGFGTAILAPGLKAFALGRPRLRIELAAESGFRSAGRREVDVAVTLSPQPGARVVVEPLTEYQLALFAAPEYLARAGRPERIEDLGGHDLVGYVDDLLYAPELRYLDEIRSGLRPTLASSSIRAQREIVLSGGGVGVLPCFLSTGLEPVLLDHVLLTRRFWINTHAEVAATARVRTVRRWLLERVDAARSVLAPYEAAKAASACLTSEPTVDVPDGQARGV